MIGFFSGSFVLVGIIVDFCVMELFVLVLIMVGFVIGILFGGVGLIFGGMKIVVIKWKCVLVMVCLEKYEEICKKMKVKLKVVKKNIDVFKVDIWVYNNLDIF